MADKHGWQTWRRLTLFVQFVEVQLRFCRLALHRNYHANFPLCELGCYCLSDDCKSCVLTRQLWTKVMLMLWFCALWKSRICVQKYIYFMTIYVQIPRITFSKHKFSLNIESDITPVIIKVMLRYYSDLSTLYLYAVFQWDNFVKR